MENVMSKSKFFLVTFEGNVMRKVDLNKMKEDMIGTIDDHEDEPWREKESKKKNLKEIQHTFKKHHAFEAPEGLFVPSKFVDFVSNIYSATNIVILYKGELTKEEYEAEKKYIEDKYKPTKKVADEIDSLLGEISEGKKTSSYNSPVENVPKEDTRTTEDILKEMFPPLDPDEF
jgi:hypothetical protein